MPIHATPDGWVLESRNIAYALGLNRAGGSLTATGEHGCPTHPTTRRP